MFRHVVLSFLLVSGLACFVLANNANSGQGVSISIAPSALVLKSPVSTLTVHSNIPYASVITGTVVLDGMSPYMVKADDLGDLVAKFDITELKETLAPGRLTMTLSVETVNGELIEASDTLMVR